MIWPPLVFDLPEWVAELAGADEVILPETRARMEFVLRLAAENVRHGAGGPFGAAVFDLPSGRLLAPGVNSVTRGGCSLFHAEMMALALAQRRLGHYDLGRGAARRELVTSAEPCAMCLGAIPWSGVRQLVCAARDEDVRRFGFDEGAKPPDWAGELTRRGIDVVRDIARAESVAILQSYHRAGGRPYNSREK